ncbi:DNA replication and repair protein RecN [Geothermobacter ehrlichii]|uniref:DNA repair protein RecN n=1 Tax=Geothermobacter ehrlichii TaxID=213224 RepID=A0A5D3WL54_9BACT|nr:DNA repair protein RecN [Geothermobacter ehrlichii]TYO98243.1 DNA replication and repair protein RecN [Geothermobacter ehrlichii]
MLRELVIRNFAIIDRLEVSLKPGFNILTGETGAGKSIIIDAVGLLIGGRARPEVIRAGTDEATVEGLFDIAGLTEVKRQLEASGFEVADELTVKRVISREGKNRIFINGSIARLGQLQDISRRLVNIYGQHEHQLLQKPEAHLNFLDHFAGLQQQRRACADCHAGVKALRDELEQLEQGERDRQQRLDFLRFQRQEIAAAALRPGEDEELEQERKLLKHGEKLSQATGGGYESLYGGANSVCEIVSRLAGELENLAEIDPLLGTLAETLRSSQYSLEDVALQLRDFSSRLSFEPGRQNEVEERLARIGQLKRKYAPTVEGILERLQQVEAELDRLEHADSRREELAGQLRQAEARLRELGQDLSARRRRAAEKMARAVERELADLAMPGSRFEVHFFDLDEPGPRGLERIEFYLSTNPGEDPKPLAWIASGGELSRIMLALKQVAPEADGVSTLVFDEVDAGIGGEAASAVGRKLKKVARGLQVLCITHLPQVAAFGDNHYRVEKMVDGGRTFTAMVALGDETRVREMARMLGGDRVTERTLEHAREMIEAVAREKDDGT